MKKNLMNYVAGRMLLTILFCCAMTSIVSAQTAETESKMEKYLRLSKEADENPTNWQSQQGGARLCLPRIACHVDDGCIRQEGH